MSNTTERIKEYLYKTGARDFTALELQQFFEEEIRLESEEEIFGTIIHRHGEQVYKVL